MAGERSRSPYLSILLILLVLLAPLALSVLPSVGAELLADKHAKSGVDCAGCHKKVPPEGPPSPTVCYGCHGDISKVAERTQKLPHNPHDSHRPDFDCDACHHLHKPSEDRCTPCHQFGVRVP